MFRLRMLLRLAKIFFCLFALIRQKIAQNGICPLGFVWGGQCGLGVVCPPSLPPFHCLRSSCCRDQRPLFARLGPIVYPQDLLGGGGGLFPGGTFGGRFNLNSLLALSCFDNASNCFLFLPYCFQPIYQLCMLTHCRRTCGYCAGFGTALGGAGGLGGLGVGNIGTFGSDGGLLGGAGGFNGLGAYNGFGTFGASPVLPGIG
ncbi:hypothetical protein niasHT_007574 [Heterodera trifolii]|uniref:ShKT domain-containing protein n=1 Tax=Heterodera trifolii TaxID=157864 RepID=A0ABD2LPK1_9BILA